MPILRSCALAAIFLATGRPGAVAESASDRFFASGLIPVIHIQIAQTNLARLRARPREYVHAILSEGDRIYENVGIHLKGAAGSYREIDDDKPALTLNFDKFVRDQKFHGLDKLSLNNSVQDPTYMTEAICSELFLAAGVPTPRTGHARVLLNGRDLGLYVLKEGFDKSFLKRHFKNPNGNLYDGGFLRDINESLERTSGDTDVRARADLKALVAATTEDDPTRRLERIGQSLDLDRFIDFAALEMLTWHWDGYLMKKNNYRVYHDPDSGKLTFLPHGMDQMFWDPNGPVIPRGRELEGLVARALFETAEGQRLYREHAVQITATLFTVERLTNHMDQLHSRLQPVLAAMSAGAARNHDDAVASLRRQVTLRARVAAQKLLEPPPARVQFDASGITALIHWQKLDLRGTGQLDQTTTSDGVPALHVAAGPEGRCTASWRSRMVLPIGTYVLEGRVRTAGVVPLEKDVNTKGIGAGLRQSGKSREHGFAGDHVWQSATQEVVVSRAEEETALACELRAEKGEAWFDLGSLRLRRVTTTMPAQ